MIHAYWFLADEDPSVSSSNKNSTPLIVGIILVVVIVIGVIVFIVIGIILWRCRHK